MWGGGRLSSWVQTHPLRACLYGTLAGLFLAAVLSISSPKILSGILTWLVDRPLFHRQLEQIGLRYSVQGVRLRLFQGDNSLHLEIENPSLEFLFQPFVVRIERIEFSSRRGFVADRIQAGTRGHADLIQVETSSFEPASQKAVAQNVGIPFGSDPSRSGAIIGEVVTQGVRFRGGPSGWPEIEKVVVSGVETHLARDPDGTWDLSRARLLSELFQEFVARPPISITAIEKLLAQYRSFLLWAILAASALLLLLKAIVTLSDSQPVLRAVVIIFAVLSPIVCYLLFFRRVTLAGFLLLSLLVSVVAASLLELLQYRKRLAWHERWEPFALDVFSPLILLPLLCVRGVLPSSLTLPNGIRIGETQLREVKTAVRFNNAEAGNTIRLTLPYLVVDDFALGAGRVLSNVPTITFRRARLQAELEADFSRALQKIRYLPAQWRVPQRVTVCAEVRGFPSGVKPVLSADLSGLPCLNHQSETASVSVLAAASLLPSPLKLAFVSRGRIQTPGIGLLMDTEGDQEGVRIRSIHSTDESRVKIQHGSAALRLSREIEVEASFEGVGLMVGRVLVAIREVDAKSRLFASGPKVRSQIQLGLRRLLVKEQGGLAMHADLVSSTLEYREEPRGSPVAMESSIAGITVAAKRPGETSAWFEGEFPRATLKVDGRFSSGVIPESFAGRANLLISRSSTGEWNDQNLAFNIDKPVVFSADLWHGTVHVKNQDVRLHQSLIPQAPRLVSTRLSAVGRLDSLIPETRWHVTTRMEVPTLAFEVKTSRAELNDLSLDLDWAVDQSGYSSKGDFHSGWNRFMLPEFPASFDLKEVTSLSLKSDGTATLAPSDGENILQTLSSINLFRTPSVLRSREIKFRVSGAMSPQGINSVVTLPSGAGVAARRMSFRVHKLAFRCANLGHLESDLSVESVSTLHEGGDIRLDSSFSLSRERVQGTVGLGSSRRETGSVLQWEYSAPRLSVRAARPLHLGELQKLTAPFLGEFGVSLAGVEAQATVRGLSTSADFDGARLKGLELETDIAPGPLAALDLSRLVSGSEADRFKSLRLSLDGTQQDPGLRLRLSLAGNPKYASIYPTTGSIEIQHLTAKAGGEDGRQLLTHLTADSTVKGVLAPGVTPTESPLAQRVVSTVRAAFKQFQNGSKMLLDGKVARIPAHVQWQFEMGNRTAGVPVISVEPDRYVVEFVADLGAFSWRTSAKAQAGRLAAKSGVSADLCLHEDYLVLDAFAPLDVSFQSSHGPRRQFRVQLPLLIALADHRAPAPAGSRWLWDADQHKTFWRSYAPRHAAEQTGLIDLDRDLSLGPISIRRPELRTGPLRLTLAMNDGIQLSLPLTARVFGGQVQGLMQGDVQWINAGAVVNGLVELGAQRIQATSFGIGSAGRHLPLVEDQLDGDFHIRMSNATLKREDLATLFSHLAAFEPLGHLDMKFRVRSSSRTPPTPGIIQARVQTEVDLLNETLNAIVSGVGLAAPPAIIKYDRMRAELEVENGMIKTGNDLFRLEGLGLLSSEGPMLKGDLRIHLAEKSYPLRELINLGQRIMDSLRTRTGEGMNGPGDSIADSLHLDREPGESK